MKPAPQPKEKKKELKYIHCDLCPNCGRGMCGIDHYGPEKPVGNHSGTGLRKAVTYHCQPSPKAQESGLRDTEWTDEERVDFANAFEEIETVLWGQDRKKVIC